MGTESWFDFEGQVVLVSGGAGAIGREVAAGFAKHGAHVGIIDVDGVAAKEVADGLGSGISAELDVRDAGAVEALVATAWDAHGRIDVLVNAAAIYVRAPAVDLTEDEYDRTMDINVKGTWLLSQAVGRRMIERGSGRIINYSSNAGNRGSALQVAYNASKAAIDSITKTLAVEWGRTGVTVNAVAPGPTNTALMAPAFDNPGMIDAFSQRVPQGSLTSTDVTVGPVLFLASPMASSITGHTLYADGGMSAT
jgi:NAD(P)-dependent dehydrogenase (short-subunit alcohol dehydrogenase family)